MKDKAQRHETPEIHEMAKKLGVDLKTDELQSALGEQTHQEAVSRCETCGSVGECHFFLGREVNPANNKRWWLKSFCANAELLMRLAEDKSNMD